MRSVISVAAFVLVVVASFVWFSRSVPQSSRADSGPIEIGESPEELMAAGKQIFERENSCLTCHSLGEDPKARCPNLEPVWEQAVKRRPEITAAEYLVQSVYDPGAYTVEGFPENQMKPVNRPPIGLSDDEIKAVLCYLVSLSIELTDEQVRDVERAQGPYSRGEIIVAQSDEGFVWPEGDPEEGEFIFEEMKCLQCHVVFGKGGSDSTNSGPDLTSIGSIQTRQYLFESIVSPNAVIVKGETHTTIDGATKMPEYHDTMTLRWLVDLVTYMATLQGGADEEAMAMETEAQGEQGLEPDPPREESWP
jgi:mono/diheme cytochrome c family protein